MIGIVRSPLQKIPYQPHTRAFGIGTRDVRIADVGNAEVHTKGGAALKTRDAGNLPAAEDRTCHRIVGAAEMSGDVRQIIDVIDREVVTAIKVGRTVIGQARVAVDSDEVAVAGHGGQRFAPRVSHPEEQPLGKAAVESDLQRVVVRSAAHLMESDGAEALIAAEEV